MIPLLVVFAAAAMGALLGSVATIGLLAPGRVRRARERLAEDNPELYSRLTETDEEQKFREWNEWRLRREGEDRWAREVGGTEILEQVRRAESIHAAEHGYEDPNLPPPLAPECGRTAVVPPRPFLQ